MNRNSLATRLGIKVGLMTAILVAALSIICYFLLSQGLERIVKSNLRAKMEGVEHKIGRAHV